MTRAEANRVEWAHRCLNYADVEIVPDKGGVVVTLAGHTPAILAEQMLQLGGWETTRENRTVYAYPREGNTE